MRERQSSLDSVDHWIGRRVPGPDRTRSERYFGLAWALHPIGPEQVSPAIGTSLQTGVRACSETLMGGHVSHGSARLDAGSRRCDDGELMEVVQCL